MTTVTLGDLVLPPLPNGPFGFYLREKGLVDWYAIPASKTSGAPRPNGHGSFSGGFDFRDAATPSVGGSFVGPSPEAALLAMEDLAALAGGDPVRMTVADGLRTTSRDVSIRFVTIPDPEGQSSFDFDIDTLAPDPLRYGAAVGSSTGVPVSGGGLEFPVTFPITFAAGGADGRVAVANPGTAPAFPVLEVTGGLSGGFSLVEIGTGREIRFERLIPEGSKVTVLPRTGRAYIDAPGNDVSGFLTRSDWFEIPARGSTAIQFLPLGAATGSPTFSALTAPAFW